MGAEKKEFNSPYGQKSKNEHKCIYKAKGNYMLESTTVAFQATNFQI